MEKVINLLKLKNEATEMDIIDAIENKDTVNAELVAENDELKARLKVIEDKENEAKEAALNDLKDKANAMVEKAITEKKIEESEKESTIEKLLKHIEDLMWEKKKLLNLLDRSMPGGGNGPFPMDDNDNTPVYRLGDAGVIIQELTA